MDSAAPATVAGRDPFMPRPPRVRGRAIALAVLAHVLLIVAIAFGVDWKNTEPTTVAAELWSATPQAAAPRAVEPPQPTPTPTPTPPPEPTPKPPEPAPPPPKPAPEPTPALPDPQIAIEKAKRDDAKRVAAEEAQQRAKREKADRERERAEAEREKRARDEQAQKLAAAEKVKADKAKAEKEKVEKEKAAKAEAAAEAVRAAARDDYIKRMQRGLAGANGGANDTGTALRSSAPSEGYLGRIAARIKPNIVLTDAVDGNPRAEVEVKLAPDGSIASKRLVKSSGSKAWDDAVLRAIERTEILPLDGGRVPPPITIGFRPRD